MTVIAWLLVAPFWFLTFLAWSSVYALLFQLLAVYLLVLSFEEKRLHFASAAGAVTALAAFTRQTVGVAEFLVVVFLLTLLALADREERVFTAKCLQRFVLGFSLISAVLLAWLATNGALPAWWTQTVVGPLKWTQLEHAKCSVSRRSFQPESRSTA